MLAERTDSRRVNDGLGHRWKRGLVVLIFIFASIILPLSSASSAHAAEEPLVGTEADEGEPPSVLEEEPEEKELTPAKTIQPDTESTVEAVTEAFTAEETIDTIDQQQPVPAATNIHTPSAVPTLGVEFDCWHRTSATSYQFYIDVESSQLQVYPAGGVDNVTTPSIYQLIVTEAFNSGSYSQAINSWDGEPFTWEILGNTIEVSTSNEMCELPTLYDHIVENDKLNTLEQLVTLADGSYRCDGLIEALSDPAASVSTGFLPSDAAFDRLVRTPGSSDVELLQLVGNPDEVCALLGGHFTLGYIAKHDVPMAGATYPAILNDLDGIFAQRIGAHLFVEGATVVVGDMYAANGIAHIVDDVLLPQSVATIDTIETNKTAPALSGAINASTFTADLSSLCVLVRIDGVPYVADVVGASWMIKEEIVSLNPTKTTTLFDIVVRQSFDGLCQLDEEVATMAALTTQQNLPVTHGGPLVGLTMTRGVISHTPTPDPEPADTTETGGVLAVTTAQAAPTVVESQPHVVAGAACTKGVCGDSVAQSSGDDSNQDNTQPDGSGSSDAGDGDSDQSNGDSSESDGDNNLLLWFVAGAAIVLIWYLLWQRTGSDS